MHIKLPYAFHVTGYVPGTRKMDRVIAADWCNLNVATAGHLDAPVCMSWKEIGGYKLSEAYGVGDDGQVNIRSFGGHFFRQLTDFGKPLHVENIEGRVLHDYSSKQDAEKLMAAQITFAEGVKSYPRPTFKGETFTDEQDIVEVLTTKAEELLVIDGEVWERCPEPVLIVQEDMVRHHEVVVTAAFSDKYASGAREKHYTFAMDELPSAMSFIEARRRDTGLDLPAEVAAEIVVFTPELLSRTHLADDVIRHSVKFVNNAGRFTLNQAGPDYSRNWLAFSEATTRASVTPDETNIQLLLDAWVEFANEEPMDAGNEQDAYCRSMAPSLYERFSERAFEPEALFNAKPKI